MSWLLQIQMLWSLGCMYLFKLWFSLQIRTCMEFLDITVFLVIVFKKKNYTVLHGGCYSFAQSCPTLCDLMDGSTRHFPVLHHLPELAQTHVHSVGNAIQPSHPLSSPSPPTFNLSQPQGLFRWVSSLYQVTKVLEFQLQHQSFQWIFRLISFRIDWFDILAVQRTLKNLLQHHSYKLVGSLKSNNLVKYKYWF